MVAATQDRGGLGATTGASFSQPAATDLVKREARRALFRCRLRRAARHRREVASQRPQVLELDEPGWHGEARLEGGKRRQSPHSGEALASCGLAQHGLAQPEALRVEVSGRRSNALQVAQHKALSLRQQRVLGALQVGIEDGKRRDSGGEAGEAGGRQWCGCEAPTTTAAARASAHCKTKGC